MRSVKGRNVLVTGGAGFIGSHLVDALLLNQAGKVVVVDNFFLGKAENLQGALQNHKNTIVYRDDAQNLGTMKAVIAKEKVDIVYNLATIALNYSFFNPFDAYMVNVRIAEVLLHLLQDKAYETLIHSSSSEAYGTAQYSPMDENHPLHPTTPYAAGKAAADMLIMSFYNVLKLDISIIRPFNNYGPRQNCEGPLAGIIPLTIKKILDGKQPSIDGDGEQTRDFIYVSDTVRAFLLAYENEKSRGEIINLGSGQQISMIDLIRLISDDMGYDGEIMHNPGRPADVRNLCASAIKAKNILGFSPLVDFKAGLHQTIEWYKDTFVRR